MAEPARAPRNTAPIPSRFSRAWRRCASGRGCISATPTTARACTIWSTRSSTTGSTRRWAAGRRRWASSLCRQVGGRHRQRARHTGRDPRGRGGQRGRGHHDPAACGREVRPEQLQGLGGLARGGGQRGERALGLAGAADLARGVRALRAVRGRVHGGEPAAGRPGGGQAGDRGAIPGVARDVLEPRLQLQDAGASAAGAGVPELGGADHAARPAARRGRGGRAPVRGRRAGIRALPRPVEDAADPGADLDQRRAGRDRRRGRRCGGTTATTRRCCRSPTTSRSATAGRISRASAAR